MEHQESAAPIELSPTDSRPATRPEQTVNTNDEPRLRIDCSSPSDTSGSVPSLRFPRPLGNRQLHNWVSSSSPDIMQPSQVFDEDSSLVDLGYDIIGTDGESQAESTTSSIDYQRVDCQSPNGTDTGTDVETVDAETDTSDEEEDAHLNDAEPISVGTPSDSGVIVEPLRGANGGNDTADAAAHGSDADELSASADPRSDDEDIFEVDAHGVVERDDFKLLVARSSENITNVNQDTIRHPILGSITLEDQSEQSVETIRGLPQEHPSPKDLPPEKLFNSEKLNEDSSSQEANRKDSCQLTWDCVSRQAKARFEKRRHLLRRALMLVLAFGLYAIIPTLVTDEVLRMVMPAPKVISTVPVAHVAPSLQPTTSNPAALAGTASKLTQIAPEPDDALETKASSNSLAILSFGKDHAHPKAPVLSATPRICSVEKSGRNTIMITIPSHVKSHGLMIAVSRGSVDLPTIVLPVEDGFVIELPVGEAYGVMDVSIASVRKPKINEFFQVNFGRHAIEDAFDAGKQFMRGFAQGFAKTVNETSLWAEGTCLPAFDVVSRQVSNQSASVSGSVIRGLKKAQRSASNLSTHLFAKMTPRFGPANGEPDFSYRAKLELARQTRDLGDGLSLGLLRAQLNSKLWWLKIQGKSAEYDQYMAKAEVHYQQKTAVAEEARRQRKMSVLKDVLARRLQERREPRVSFWAQ